MVAHKKKDRVDIARIELAIVKLDDSQEAPRQSLNKNLQLIADFLSEFEKILPHGRMEEGLI